MNLNNKMPKKYSVFRDELGIDHVNGGIYCFMAFEYFDKNNKAVFKIGQTTRELRKRGDNYHTYFPMGVTTIASLANPTRCLKNYSNMEVRKKHYEKIEKVIMKYVIENGGYQIISTAKMKDNGKTEWVYTTQKIIDDAFEEAHTKFGGELEIEFDLKHEEYVQERRNKLSGNNYLAKIIYPLVPPQWQVNKSKKKK